MPETAYDVTVIKLQYDAIASWPDRPWNLLADLNALYGALVYHGTDHYSYAAQMVLNGEVPPEDITTVVNSKGGTTTTYNIQQDPALTHLMLPYFPNTIQGLDTLLTPMINQGYSQLTPNAGLHLGPGGRLVDQNGQPMLSHGKSNRPTGTMPATRRPTPSVKRAPVTSPTVGSNKRAAAAKSARPAA